MKKNLSTIVKPGMLVGSIFIGLLILALGLFVVIDMKKNVPLANHVTAIVTIIPFYPTGTIAANGENVNSKEDETEEETNKALGTIYLGSYVKIYGTNGKGLRLRSGPGLDSNIVHLAMDEEIYQIIEGPIEQDNFLWWKLIKLSDGSVKGWAVEDYLKVVDKP